MTRRLVGIAAGALLLVAGIWTVYAVVGRHSQFEYSGTVETRGIQVGSKVGGRVTAVLGEEGQKVKAGVPLVHFESDELQAQRAQAVATVQQSRADLDRMLRGNRPEEIKQAEEAAAAERAALAAARNGPRPQEIDQAKADYTGASADAVDAEKNFERMKHLVERDEVSRQDFDDATDKRDAAAQRAEAARQRLALLQAGTRPEDLEAAQARYRQAQAASVLAQKGFRDEDIEAARGRLAAAEGHVAELDARLREAELRAPDDAVIEVVSVRPGDLIPPGQIVMTLLEASQLWVKIYIPETELGRVHLGQNAEVRIDTFPGRVFTGKIEQIASEAEFLPRNVQTKDDREHQVFGAKVYVDNSQGVLKSGMSATVRLQ